MAHVFLSNRAAASLSLRRYTAASLDAQRAIALQPDYGKAHARLGQAKYFLRDYAGAVQAYEDSVEFDPDNAVTWTYLTKAKSKLLKQQQKLGGEQQQLGVEQHQVPTVNFDTPGSGNALVIPENISVPNVKEQRSQHTSSSQINASGSTHSIVQKNEVDITSKNHHDADGRMIDKSRD